MEQQSSVYSYKTYRVGSLAFHTPYLYHEERNKLVDHYFELGRSKGHSDEALVNFIKKPYRFKYGEDAFYDQLEQLVLRKLARRKKPIVDMRDGLFDIFFKETKELFNVRSKKGKEEQHKYIRDGILENFGKTADTDDYIEEKVKKHVKNYFNRIKRAKRKGELNYFNYFVTFEKITCKPGSLTPLDYIQKYMNKTDERLYYSRHIPTCDIIELDDEVSRIKMLYNDGKTTQSYIISGDYLPKKIPGRFGSLFGIAELPYLSTA